MTLGFRRQGRGSGLGMLVRNEGGDGCDDCWRGVFGCSDDDEYEGESEDERGHGSALVHDAGRGDGNEKEAAEKRRVLDGHGHDRRRDDHDGAHQLGGAQETIQKTSSRANTNPRNRTLCFLRNLHVALAPLPPERLFSLFLTRYRHALGCWR